MPRRLALVTSPTGAAVRDFLRLLHQRFPRVHALIYPVKVQGAEAAGEITQALDDLGAYPGVEVIVLARGGGSLEDLWPFNEEIVARAIHRCPVPVVSAVGHEVDFTIADFVADMRAPTTSAAVELVTPERAELLRQVDGLGATLTRRLNRRLTQESRHLLLMARRLPDLRRMVQDWRQRVDERGDLLTRRARRVLLDGRQKVRLAASRLALLSPRREMATTRQRLDQAGQLLMRLWQQSQAARRQCLANCQGHLEKLNPLAILSRGYAVATLLPQGTVLRDAAQAQPGAAVQVRLAQGRLDCEVIESSSK